MAESRAEAPPQVAHDVIVAQATPPGESAVGMIRLSGAGCAKIAARCILWPRHELAPRAATLAKIFAREQLLDQAVLTYFPGPSSYTGEDMLEICTHGSPYVLAKTLESLAAAGARPAEPGEFTQRAYVNGRMDLAQAEAVCRVIRAKTRLAHRAALHQLEGGLSLAVGKLRSELLDILAALEADLDHPDEDLPAVAAGELRPRIGRVRREISALAKTHQRGRLLADGARIAIAGRPNVGKSSLLNALLGRERAIVSEIPGTTRDTLEEWADLDGLQALFIDTAGLRADAADSVERAGMERTRKALAACDLALLVLDRSQPLESEDFKVIREIALICGPEERPVIVVLNKSDLDPFPGIEHSIVRHPRGSGGPYMDSRLRGNDETVSELQTNELLPSWDILAVSATKGLGLQDLTRAISRKLAAAEPAPESGVVITSLRHRMSLEQAEAALGKAESCVSRSELASLHLRESLVALAGIVGETTSEDILKSIFSKFCVGK